MTGGDEERAYRPVDWYTVGVDVVHSARFEEDTPEIEFWFRSDAPPIGG